MNGDVGEGRNREFIVFRRQIIPESRCCAEVGEHEMSSDWRTEENVIREN